MAVQLVQRVEVRPLVESMEGIPQLLGCIKEATGAYVYVNAGFADRVGLSPEACLGKTVADIFPPDFADSYAAQDAVILQTGRPLQHHLELIVRADGSIGWYVTAKTRLESNDGEILGIAVLSVDLRSHVQSAHSGLAQALGAIRVDPGYPWRVADLAGIAGISPKKFQRLARSSLGLAPQSLIQRIRIEHAVHLMTTTRQSLGAISAECGFYDQSSFTRQFTKLLGLTPGAYRRVR
jgi:PAS domain S-box-containing protein